MVGTITIKYIAVIMITQGSMTVAEIEYPDALESRAECLEYGYGVAETFMSGYWTRDDIDHNNLPLVQLRCREA